MTKSVRWTSFAYAWLDYVDLFFEKIHKIIYITQIQLSIAHRHLNTFIK